MLYSLQISSNLAFVSLFSFSVVYKRIANIIYKKETRDIIEELPVEGSVAETVKSMAS